MSNTWLNQYVISNGIRFHVARQGSGPLILLLHGFPENHYAWRYQLAGLSEHHTVAAPDLRGYHLTEKKGPFDIKTLSADITGIIRQLGFHKAILVGHDWGAFIMWQFALDYPGWCEKLISLNVPYLPRGPKPLHEMLTDSRFDYMRLFQKPGDAEAMIGSDVNGFFKRMYEGYSRQKNFMSASDQQYFVEAFEAPNAITPALEYYRNLTRNWELTEKQVTRKIRVPTLMVVADQDPLLTPAMFDHAEKYVPDVTIKHINAGHWSQQEAPNDVNQLILDFIA